MHRKTLWLGLMSAALGAAVLQVYLARYEHELAGGAPRSVLISTRDLTLGETLARSSITVRSIPESYIEERHIRADSLEKILGARVTSAVGGGGAIFWSDLDTMQDGRTLAGLVRIGMRAFELAAQDVSFDGLLRPGDKVDIVFVSHEASGASTLLSNILVLTVGGDLGQYDEARKGERRGRVTLSVTPEQATVLAHKEGSGRFRLSLRNPQDAVVRESRDVRDNVAQSSVQGDARYAR